MASLIAVILLIGITQCPKVLLYPFNVIALVLAGPFVVFAYFLGSVARWLLTIVYLLLWSASPFIKGFTTGIDEFVRDAFQDIGRHRR